MTCGTSSPEHRRSRGQAGAKADFRPRLPLLRPPPLSPRLAFSSAPGVPGSLRIFPESPRRILCAEGPPQLPGLCLAFSSPRACVALCLALCPVFPAPRRSASAPGCPACLSPLAPRFSRRPPLCPMVLAAVSLSATGFASHAVFPPLRPVAPRAHPRMPRPSLPAAFPSSFVFRAGPRAPFDENRRQSPCAQSEAMRVQGI